jgi:hypothetical protein
LEIRDSSASGHVSWNSCCGSLGVAAIYWLIRQFFFGQRGDSGI